MLQLTDLPLIQELVQALLIFFKDAFSHFFSAHLLDTALFWVVINILIEVIVVVGLSLVYLLINLVFCDWISSTSII